MRSNATPREIEVWYNENNETFFLVSVSAFNPKSSEYVRKKYKKKLDKFEETCNLIRYLGDNMTVRYKEPEARPIDFNFKLEKFLQLNTHQAVWDI